LACVLRRTLCPGRILLLRYHVLQDPTPSARLLAHAVCAAPLGMVAGEAGEGERPDLVVRLTPGRQIAPPAANSGWAALACGVGGSRWTGAHSWAVPGAWHHGGVEEVGRWTSAKAVLVILGPGRVGR